MTDTDPRARAHLLMDEQGMSMQEVGGCARALRTPGASRVAEQGPRAGMQQSGSHGFGGKMAPCRLRFAPHAPQAGRRAGHASVGFLVH